MGRAGHIIREIKTTVSKFKAAEVNHDGCASKGDAHTLARSSIYDSPRKEADVAPLTTRGSL